MIEKFGTAEWSGSLKEGGGTISTQSGALSKVAYGHAKRFGDEAGTNPEELIGAAHAACFSMFLSALMGGEGIGGIAVETTSTITLDPGTPGSPTVTKAHLVTSVKGDASADKLKELAEKAKANCPISKLLNAEVTMEAKTG